MTPLSSGRDKGSRFLLALAWTLLLGCALAPMPTSAAAIPLPGRPGGTYIQKGGGGPGGIGVYKEEVGGSSSSYLDRDEAGSEFRAARPLRLSRRVFGSLRARGMWDDWAAAAGLNGQVQMANSLNAAGPSETSSTISDTTPVRASTASSSPGPPAYDAWAAAAGIPAPSPTPTAIQALASPSSTLSSDTSSSPSSTIGDLYDQWAMAAGVHAHIESRGETIGKRGTYEDWLAAAGVPAPSSASVESAETPDTTSQGAATATQAPTEEQDEDAPTDTTTPIGGQYNAWAAAAGIPQPAAPTAASVDLSSETSSSMTSMPGSPTPTASAGSAPLAARRRSEHWRASRIPSKRAEGADGDDTGALLVIALASADSKADSNLDTQPVTTVRGPTSASLPTSAIAATTPIHTQGKVQKAETASEFSEDTNALKEQAPSGDAQPDPNEDRKAAPRPWDANRNKGASEKATGVSSSFISTGGTGGQFNIHGIGIGGGLGDGYVWDVSGTREMSTPPPQQSEPAKHAHEQNSSQAAEATPSFSASTKIGTPKPTGAPASKLLKGSQAKEDPHAGQVGLVLTSNDPAYGPKEVREDLKRIMAWAGDSDELDGGALIDETVAAILSASARYYPELPTRATARVIMADIKAESDFRADLTSPGRLDSGDSLGLMQVSPGGASQELTLFKEHARVDGSSGPGPSSSALSKGGQSGLGPLLDWATGKQLDVDSLKKADLFRPWINIHVASWIQSNSARTASSDPYLWAKISQAQHTLARVEKTMVSDPSSISERALFGGDDSAEAAITAIQSQLDDARAKLRNALKGGGHSRSFKTALGTWVAGASTNGDGSYGSDGDDISAQYLKAVAQGVKVLYSDGDGGSGGGRSESDSGPIGINWLDSLRVNAGLVDYRA